MEKYSASDTTVSDAIVVDQMSHFTGNLAHAMFFHRLDNFSYGKEVDCTEIYFALTFTVQVDVFCATHVSLWML